jgi:hypothetical protein
MSLVGEQHDDSLVDPLPYEDDAATPIKLDVGVAIAVTLTAAFLAVCVVHASSTVRSMTGLEVQIVEATSFADATETPPVRDVLTADAQAPASDEQRAARLARWERRRVDIASRAEGLTHDYDRLADVSRQLDLSEVVLSAAIVLFGVTALAQKRWIFGIGVACALFGISMAVLGFFGMHVESAWLLTIARL